MTAPTEIGDRNRYTAVAEARQAIMWAGVPAVEAERYATLAVDAITHAGLLLPTGTYTVEQFNSRLYRAGTLMDEPDTAETREHAQARVDWHARKREAEPGWPGVAVLVRRYQHTTPWATVEETP